MKLLSENSSNWFTKVISMYHLILACSDVVKHLFFFLLHVFHALESLRLTFSYFLLKISIAFNQSLPSTIKSFNSECRTISVVLFSCLEIGFYLFVVNKTLIYCFELLLDVLELLSESKEALVFRFVEGGDKEILVHPIFLCYAVYNFDLPDSNTSL